MNHEAGRSLEARRVEVSPSVVSAEAVKAVVDRTASMLAMSIKGFDQTNKKVDRKTDEVGPTLIDAVFEVGSDLGETDTAPSSVWRPIPRE